MERTKRRDSSAISSGVAAQRTSRRATHLRGPGIGKGHPLTGPGIGKGHPLTRTSELWVAPCVLARSLRRIDIAITDIEPRIALYVRFQPVCHAGVSVVSKVLQCLSSFRLVSIGTNEMAVTWAECLHDQGYDRAESRVLRKLLEGVAASEHKSAQELCREVVEGFLRQRLAQARSPETDRYSAIRKMIGMVKEGPTDASIHHDCALGEKP